jgi:pyruvate dehydrogenase (quinone)
LAWSETSGIRFPRFSPAKEKTDTTFLDRQLEQYREAEVKFRSNLSRGHKDKISGKYLAAVVDRLAKDDALFVSDDGTSTVWLHRHVRANGKRRMYASLLHGTMGGGVATALGLQKCQPGRQVVAFAGDGGFSMMLGDVLTTVQENLPIKICVFDNAKLGFVEIEQKSEGLLPTFTTNQNPNFGAVARAMGLWGKDVVDPEVIDEAVAEWLAQPGPAVLNVHVAPLELVMPPFTEFKPAYGMTMYSLKAIMHGGASEVIGMISQNI